MSDDPIKQDAPTVDTADGGAATATEAPPVRKPAKAPHKPKELPPYKVLLHNDQVNTMEHVILTIVQLTPLQAEEAFHRMLEAHETGVALLLTTHLERAELYRDQFASRSLTVSIEPA